MKHFFTIIIIIAFCTNNATAQTSSRLIAQSYYSGLNGNLIPYDSTRYFFVSATSALNSQKFDYQYATAWVLLHKYDYTYNTAGNLINMQYQNWNTTTNAYTNGGITMYFLNSAGFCIKDSNLLWIPANNAYRNNVRNTYTVNAAGQVTDNVYYSWDVAANGLLPYFHYVNTYNAHGKQLSVLNQQWDASIHWMDHYLTTMTYNATDTGLQTVTGKQDAYTPGVLATVYQNVYTLNANGTVASYLNNNWNNNTSSYTPAFRTTVTYNASGDNTLLTEEQWNVATNAYKPYDQFVRTYNSHHQLTSDTRIMWSATTNSYSTLYSRYNYYYEDYTPASQTGVANTNDDATWLSLAPIPTTGQLHIALKWAEPQAFTVTITDMTGRMCNTFSEAATAEYRKNTDLGNLPAGNYIVTIKGQHGTTISRTIVVAH